MKPYRVPRCHRCRYSLEGIDEDEGVACPECGHEIDWRLARRRRRERSLIWHSIVIIGSSASAFAVFLTAGRGVPYPGPLHPVAIGMVAPCALFLCAVIYYGRLHDNFRGPPIGGWSLAVVIAALSVASIGAAIVHLIVP